MGFDTFPKSEKPKETPRQEGDSLEAGLSLLKAAFVVGHFWGEKKEEIMSVVEKAKKIGSGNPVLLGDRILHAISQFKKVVDDYQVETEELRAGLQQNTIVNLTKGEERLEVLKRQRTQREADLLNVLNGRKRAPNASQGAENPKEGVKEDQPHEATFKPTESTPTGSEASPSQKPASPDGKESIQNPEVKTFSTGFIKDRVRTFLASNKNIKEVKSIEVKGGSNEITLSIRVLAGPLGSNIGVQAILESKAGVIEIKSHAIDAGWLIKGTVEGILIPKLSNISELLKSYVEKQENKKVVKMEIVNGELVVTFK
jgi:hypothetical protein